MKASKLLTTQIALTSLLLAACGSNPGSESLSTAPRTPETVVPSQPVASPISPILVTPPVAVSPVASPEPGKTSEETSPTAPATNSGQIEAETPVPLMLLAEIVKATAETVPGTGPTVEEFLPVFTATAPSAATTAPATMPSPNLENIFSLTDILVATPAPSLQPVAEEYVPQPAVVEQVPAEPQTTVDEPAPFAEEPAVAEATPSDEPTVEPAAESAPVETQAAQPTPDVFAEPTPVAVAEPTPAVVAPPTPEVVAEPTPVVAEDPVQEIKLSGKCSDKKPVSITISDSRKANHSEKLVTKCVKSSFVVRLSFKKKDVPFILVQAVNE